MECAVLPYDAFANPVAPAAVSPGSFHMVASYPVVGQAGPESTASMAELIASRRKAAAISLRGPRSSTSNASNTNVGHMLEISIFVLKPSNN